MAHRTPRLSPNDGKAWAIGKENISMARTSYQRGFIQEKNGRYTLRYRIRDAQKGWREKRETLPLGTSHKDALQMLDKRIKAANALNNDAQRLASLGFAAFTKGVWADYLQRRKVKASTVYSYDSMLKKLILPKWGELALPDISVQHVTRFFKELEVEEYSIKYILNVYALLNVLFEVAKDHDLISDIPLRAKIHRPQCELKKKVALTSEQLRQILGEVGEEYKPLFFTAMITGARLSEVRGLRWQDLDADEGNLCIRNAVWRQVFQKPKTEASIRTLHIPRELVEVLCAHREQSKWATDDDFIFARLDGTPYDADHLRRVVLYPAMDRCKIAREKWRHGFHIFRHTAGSIVHAQTGDLKLAQELLGHSRLATTSDIYIHLPEKVAAKATEILAREITGVLGSEKVQ
jgi:integrase